MSETSSGEDAQQTARFAANSGPSAAGGLVPVPGTGELVGGAQLNSNVGQLGKIRDTGVCVLLTIVTFGIYPIVWYYMVHDEMKRHSRDGLGGGLALVLAFFVGIVMPYITSSEVGRLYENRGIKKPVSGASGLWYFPGVFILVGPLIWFIKTNGALNNYWRSLGAR